MFGGQQGVTSYQPSYHAMAVNGAFALFLGIHGVKQTAKVLAPLQAGSDNHGPYQPASASLLLHPYVFSASLDFCW